MKGDNGMRILSVSMVIEKLKQRIHDENYIFVGHGAEHEFGTTRERFNHALAELEKNGYLVYSMPDDPSAKFARYSMKG